EPPGEVALQANSEPRRGASPSSINAGLGHEGLERGWIHLEDMSPKLSTWNRPHGVLVGTDGLQARILRGPPASLGLFEGDGPLKGDLLSFLHGLLAHEGWAKGFETIPRRSPDCAEV